jgi:hypothetical protein
MEVADGDPYMKEGTNGTFWLSRIYAEGWNAANALATAEVDSLDLASLATRNPYVVEAERSRWTSGFTSALVTERPRMYRRARS